MIDSIEFIDVKEYDTVYPPKIEFARWVESLENDSIKIVEPYDPFNTVNS